MVLIVVFLSSRARLAKVSRCLDKDLLSSFDRACLELVNSRRVSEEGVVMSQAVLMWMKIIH